MTPVLETARLWLRPLDLADADQIQQIFPQWEIVRYLTTEVWEITREDWQARRRL